MSVITKAGIKWLPNTYHKCHSYIEYFTPDNPIFAKLGHEKAIVSHQKIHQAKERIMECQLGKRQFLHIGDCAQAFEDSDRDIVAKKAKFFKQCEQILSLRKNKPVSVFGRVAGQFAKPRSQQFVIKDGKKMHNYKGDNVNTLDQTERDPSTSKVYQGYIKSMQIANVLKEQNPELFYSHEGLILPYQQSLTRSFDEKYYCTSAHMIWIGERTRQLDGAHVEFFRGIQNPIGVKVSSKISAQAFHELVTTLNPKNELGKLLVIIRMGKSLIGQKLSELIRMKQKEKLNFLFVTDPMHGNTYQSSHEAGLKTRNISDILEQIRFFEVKMNEKKLKYGYSFEATYENVTECFGLVHPLVENELILENFTSKCDPRLNNNQTKHLLSILDEN